MKCEKLNFRNRREFISMIRWASKIVHEWNGHLEIFSQVKENSRQNLLLRTDILQKTVVGCPWPELWKTTIGLIAAHFLVHFLAVDLHDCNVKRPENFLVFFSRGNVVHVLVHFFHCRSFCFLFGDPRNWIFLKITRASILFFRLIELEAIVPSLP